MESYRGGLKGYWKARRPYQLVDGTKRLHRKATAIHLSGGSRNPPATRRRRRFWRVRPRLKLVHRAILRPLWLLGKIRDAYVKMMLRMANSPAFGYGGGVGGGAMFRTPATKEYDERMLVEIYKSLVAQGRIPLPADEDGGSRQAAPVG